MLADPDALAAAADRLSAGAVAVRAAARRLGRTGADLRWEGAAASSFRDGLADEVQRLQRAAAALDDAAGALHRHAGTVRGRQRSLQAAAAAALASGAAELEEHWP